MLLDMAAGRCRRQARVLVALAALILVDVELENIRTIKVVPLLLSVRNDGVLLLGHTSAVLGCLPWIPILARKILHALIGHINRAATVSS